MRTLLVCAAACFTLCVCGGTRVADLKVWFTKYSNPNGLGDNGHCCDGKWGICQRNGCDHYFVICLDGASSSNATENCKYQTTTTAETSNQNEITFSDKIGDTNNPLEVPLIAVPEKLTLKVKVYDKDSVGSDEYVDFIKYTYDVKTDLPMHTLSTKSLKGRHTTLDVSTRLFCADNQYGPLCDKFCSPVGNIKSCDQATGEPACKEGWKGENCKEPDDCPRGWLSRSKSCYLFSNLRKKWVDAQKYCREQSADLVAVDSWDESTFIKGELLKRYKPGDDWMLWWIGLNDRAQEGRWVWNDNKPVKVRNWRYGEPNNIGNEDCATVYQRPGYTYMGRWNDINCETSFIPFICEKSEDDTDEGSTDGSGNDSSSGSRGFY